ncbi:MAG: FkbM family methyltransferase [Proteobacteria bacterium]|nr:FkbM family methyltransferase [Pseudomonadota bacterium]
MTLSAFSQADIHEKTTKSADWQTVNTASIRDLLERHRAPAAVHYLSIDIEGSELEILNAFDFGRNIFSVITCEHNFSNQRKDIYNSLVRNGYVYAFEGLLVPGMLGMFTLRSEADLMR